MPMHPKTPDERARRRIGNVKTGDWVKLPLGGRHEPPPAWPLKRVEMSEDHADIWEKMWRTPMAMIWEQSPEMIIEVALYVNMALAAETSIDASRELRYYSDRLGVNPLGRLKLHWMIVPDAESDLEVKPPAPAAPVAATRQKRRLVAVQDQAQPDALEA